MGLTIPLGTLVTRCKQRAGRESDDALTPNEVKALISELVGELHGAIADTGCRVFETEVTITANGAASYALPSDHRDTIGVDLVVDAAGSRRALDEIMVQERAGVLGLTGEANYYELAGSTIALYPKPSTGTYKHLYIPQPADLSGSSDATTVDLVTTDGLAFVTWGVAVVAKDKGEAELITAMRERDRAKERVIAWAANHRSVVNPRRRITPEELSDYDAADWRWRK